MQDDEGEKVEADASEEEGVKVDAEDTLGAGFGGNGGKKTSVDEKMGSAQSGEKNGVGWTSKDHGLLKDW